MSEKNFLFLLFLIIFIKNRLIITDVNINRVELWKSFFICHLLMIFLHV